jgi:hypothetical protein
MWNCPNFGGSLDGSNVAIVKPAGEGSYYFNYKGHHRVVLLRLVVANLTFIMADVGYKKLKNGALGTSEK